MLPFGETVLVWRLTRGMSQEALARAASMSRPNLSAVERGDREVTLRTLRQLALALDVRPGILADGQPPPLLNEPLGRAALERIAGAAAHRERAANETERRISTLLADAASARIAGHDTAGGRTRASSRRRTRGVDRAYFLLKAVTSSTTVGTLIDRLAGPATTDA